MCITLKMAYMMHISLTLVSPSTNVESGNKPWFLLPPSINLTAASGLGK